MPLVIHQVRSDNKNYLVSPLPGKNHLDVGDTFKDTANQIEITFLSEQNSVATLRVVTQVMNHYRTIVEGPVRVDWHIYERIFDRLGLIEKETIVNGQKINEFEKRLMELESKLVPHGSVQPMGQPPVGLFRKRKEKK